MADLKNHQTFSLRCFSKDIIPVSIRLKSNVKTPRSLNIIKRGERSLLNERIQSNNKTIEMPECQRVHL